MVHIERGRGRGGCLSFDMFSSCLFDLRAFHAFVICEVGTTCMYLCVLILAIWLVDWLIV